jgi:hypothetical protein
MSIYSIAIGILQCARPEFKIGILHLFISRGDEILTTKLVDKKK